jgi:NitT/TauT family transport system substrate-binding protein
MIGTVSIRWSVPVGALLFLVALFPPLLRAQSKIMVPYSSLNANNAPFWIAQDKGMFEKNGLHVELVYANGGSVVAAMLAGDAPVAHVGGTPVVTANLGGADLVFLAATVNKILFQFFAGPGIDRAESLKGKTVAISRFGSGSDFALRLALNQLGLKPGKDVTVVQLGGTAARLAALHAGAIQGTVLLPPDTLIARKEGYALLVDLADTEMEFLNSGVATSRAFIEFHPDVVRRLMRAYVEGIYFFKSHKSDSMKVVGRHLRIDNPQILQELYKLYGKVFRAKPYVTRQGVESIVSALAAPENKPRNLRLDSMIESRFLKKLDENGFIDSLYH